MLGGAKVERETGPYAYQQDATQGAVIIPNLRLISGLAAVMLAVAGLSLGLSPGAAPVAAEPLPGTTCSLFPADNVLNTDVSSLPPNAQSATWMGNMTQAANIHPDLGTLAQLYGMPVNVAPPPSTGLAPTFLYDSESDHPAEGYPIDQSTLIEGGSGAPSGSDRHALVEDMNRCKLYEIYNLQNFTNGQTPQAGSGAVWDLTSNAMRPIGWTSADAAGLPITPLLLRPDEILARSITHAIRFTAHCTHGYIWPASHDAGLCGASFPPMGARFRLRANFDVSGFAPATQVVLRAFKSYGLVLADNGSDWYFQGTSDNWWGTTAGSQVVSELKTVAAAEFEAVDESSLQVAAGSYRAVSCTASPLSTSYFNWYDRASPGVLADTIHLVNTGTVTSAGCVTIAGRALAPFSVTPGQDSYVTFPPGTIGGPVAVNVDSGPPLLASQRSWYYQSLSETAARPPSAAATTQYLPWYDLSSPGMRADAIHVTNVSGSAATGSIALPGATSINFSVANGQDAYFSFPQGTIGGPVTITSTQPVLATLRAWYYQTFNETPARPASAAATSLYFPWYDLASAGMRAETVHITNESGSAAMGTIALPNVTPLNFTVPNGQDLYYAFPGGTIGGPVTITSGQPVLASLRAWYYQSFNETAARPAGAAAITQHFPWYDLASTGMRADTIHLTNESGSTATGTIALPNVTSLNFTVPNGQDVYYAFPGGTIGGPVTITSSQPVLASLRAWYYQSFNEVPSA
jgi:hypothetical protein